MWTKRRKFFTMRTISRCNKLPEEVVDAPTLDTEDLAGQGAGSSWLNLFFAKKGWNR